MFFRKSSVCGALSLDFLSGVLSQVVWAFAAQWMNRASSLTEFTKV